MLVDIHPDCCEAIVRTDIKNVLGSLEKDYKERQRDKGIAVFDTNKKRDLAMMKKHIDAMKVVLRYYGEH